MRAAGFRERTGARRDEQPIETARGLDGSKILVAAPCEKMTIGKEQRIVTVNQYAERHAVEQHEFVGGLGRRGCSGWRFGRFGFARGGCRCHERRA